MKQSTGAKTLAFPVPAWAIGTYDEDGKANVMTAAWAGICCSRPPCMAVSLRKATSTFGNLVSRKAFTISIPSEKYVREIDYIGVVSGRDVDKFEVLGLKAVAAEFVDAPFVEEFPVVIECKLLHTIEIGLHTQFIGEIMDVKADAEVLDDEGNPDAEKLRPVIFSPGTRAYHGLGEFLGKAFSIGREKRSMWWRPAKKGAGQKMASSPPRPKNNNQQEERRQCRLSTSSTRLICRKSITPSITRVK